MPLLIKRANSSGYLNIPSDEKTEQVTACDVIVFTEEAGLSQPIRRVHHSHSSCVPVKESEKEG